MPKDTNAPNTLRVSIGQYSSRGRKAENQDFHSAHIPTGSDLSLKGITVALADGISSSKVSRDASEIAVKAMMNDYYATSDAWTVRTAATRVLGATNAWLHGQNTSVDVNAGRVCTLSALILKGGEAHILHVGDSRIQRLDGASLEPLTEDHRTILSANENYLARAMGIDADIEVDYARMPLTVGDIFVLTTDGVHEFTDGRDAVAALAEDDLDAAAKHLANAAFENGSDDNLTVQIVRIDGLPDTAAGLQTDAARLPIPPIPKTGEVIDGFRILREIHVTARSHVFLAVDPDGNRVALKIPSTETAQDTAYLNRFVLEEWIARRLSSHHVLRAGAVPETRTALYVVTEFVEGITLRQWMTDHPKPDFDQVRDIIDQVAKGLRTFHRRDMVHQDLRPENVMIDADGTVKIIDLGSTSVAGVEEAAPGTLGEMPGTYQYTAPEYMSGDIVGWRSDQYSLGVLAYEMLTGRLPYGAHVARVQSRRDQMRLTYQPARDDDNGVPAWMDAALRRATHPDPMHRYDSLSECVADLRRPSTTYDASRHVPLAEKNPVRFWQSVSAGLAILCIILAVQAFS